jgi:hypothetical protein
MKTTTTIFFFLLLSICYVANAQKAFDQVRALLGNLRKSNEDDQAKADIREKNERAWCNKEIAKAVQLLARRQKDVDDLKAHIKWIIQTRAEARKDRAKRVQRIKANDALLEKFKKQRCDNNLLFVKQLREHMQAVAVLKLLRGDVIAYFNAKPKGQRGAFIEQFEEYASLLDEEHKQLFTELKSELSNLRPHVLDAHAETSISTRSDADVNSQGDRLTKQRERTEKQIGTGHVDNTRGELKKLSTPAYEKISEHNKKVRAKILGMINRLIKHLRESRRRLTADEIKAAEDFAVFHNSMEQENEYLRKKIAELTKEIKSLTNQLNIANVQLVKRRSLRNQARRALKLLRQMCEEKYAYFKRETARRTRETKNIVNCINLFNSILKKISLRVRARANAINANGKVAGVHELSHHVVKNEGGENKELAGRQKERAEVVF